MWIARGAIAVLAPSAALGLSGAASGAVIGIPSLLALLAMILAAGLSWVAALRERERSVVTLAIGLAGIGEVVAPH